MSDRKQLRQELKDARTSLPEKDRWQKAITAADILSRHSIFKRATSIGLYVAVGAECPTLPLNVLAENAGKRLHYPALGIRQKKQMHFVRGRLNGEWRTGQFNIPEPLPADNDDVISARQLDLVIMPLVGFDPQGNRLGMGAGYYDRCFAFRRHRHHWKRPLLIGLAYDCQQADRIPAEPWDVPLDGVATESGLQLFRQR